MNIGKISRSVILGSTILATAAMSGCRYSTRMQEAREQKQREEEEQIAQIKQDILYTTADSAFWADLRPKDYGYDPFLRMELAEFRHEIESRRTYAKNHEPKSNKLEYWKKMESDINKVRNRMKRHAENQIAMAQYTRNRREKRKNDHNEFINSQQFNDFIKTQKKSEKNFLKKHPNYSLIQVTRVQINEYNDASLFTNLNEVLAVEKKETPYRKKAYRTECEYKRVHRAKGAHYVLESKQVPYDAKPYKDIVSFFSIETQNGKPSVLICRKYADPNI